jgi:uncharacterized membrane protein
VSASHGRRAPPARFQPKPGLKGKHVMANPVSSANVFGHPIHPMLVPFPIAFFVATLLCDAAFWLTGNVIWVSAATWLLGAGLVMAALAALAGLTDFLGDDRIRAIPAAWQHAIGNVIAVLVSLFNFYWHYSRSADAVLPTGLVCSLAVVAMLLFTGWMGWEMVYRHRVAVYDEPAEAKPARIKERV